MKQMKWVFIVMGLSMAIAFFWESLDFVRNAVHYGLDNNLGALLGYNQYIGMILVAIVINLVIVLLQKYTIDKDTMKEVKREQKELREDMKKYKDHPEKMMEINKRQFELLGKQLPLTMRPVVFTAIPFILLFRWFHDLYGIGGIFEGTVFLGFMNWFWFYFLLTIIFSQIFRKWFDVI